MTRALESTSKAAALEELRRISEDPHGATAPGGWRRAQTLVEVQDYALQFDEEVEWEYWTGLRERMRADVALVLSRQGLAETKGTLIAGVDGSGPEAHATRFAKLLGLPAVWGVEVFCDFALIAAAAAVDGSRWPDGADLFEAPRDRARWPAGADLLAFADTLLAAYRAHLIPVGWLGRWPRGEIVVANPALLREHGMEQSAIARRRPPTG